MMTQVRDGISLAHGAALKIVRPLSVAAVVFSAAFLAMTASSYAKLHKPPNCVPDDNCTENTVVIGNNGAILGGGYAVFGPARKNTQPIHDVRGAATGIHGPAGVAITSDGQTIAVGNQLSGAVTIYGSGADGNSAPSAAIAGPTTGFDNPAGVAFLPDGSLAVTSTLGAVLEPDAGAGVCDPAVAGFSLGVIAEFAPGSNGDVTPLNNSPVNASTTPRNATIGGCDTFLLGPTGIASDAAGNLWVVNSFGGFVTEYAAGASGNAAPINLIAGGGLTVGGAEFVAVGAAGTEIYVTDAATNSVSIFDTTTPGGTLLGVISGHRTKFRSPMGVAFDGDDLYVASNLSNAFMMFDDDDGTLDLGGDIRPTVIVRGSHTNMNLPTGLAVVPRTGTAAATH